MLGGAQTQAHVNESIRFKFKSTAYHVTGRHTHTHNGKKRSGVYKTTHRYKMIENPGLDLPWPGPSRVLHSGPNVPWSGNSRAFSGSHLQWSGPFGSSFTVGRVPSIPPRVPSGPRLDWSGPTPRLGFTKILQWGRGGGGTLSSRWGGSNIVVQTLLQTGYLPEQPQTSYDPKCAHCHMHTHTQND